MSASLPLRDVHLPDAPALWPPAPGWWVVLVILLLLLSIPLLRWWRRKRRRARWRAVFDGELASAGTDDPRARLTVMVALLRRAARKQSPGLEHLQGEAWLAWLDARAQLDEAQRTLLCDGPYRPQVEVGTLQSLEAWARTRFVDLLQEHAV